MKCYGAYVCRGLRKPVQYLVEGGHGVIEYFSSTSPLRSGFEEDIAQLDNRYIRIESPEIFEYLENVDGGLCGNAYTYLFKVQITIDYADDPFNQECLSSFDKIEFYEDERIKHIFVRTKQHITRC
jgi:hypothetical protein